MVVIKPVYGRTSLIRALGPEGTSYPGFGTRGYLSSGLWDQRVYLSSGLWDQRVPLIRAVGPEGTQKLSTSYICGQELTSPKIFFLMQN